MPELCGGVDGWVLLWLVCKLPTPTEKPKLSGCGFGFGAGGFFFPLTLEVLNCVGAVFLFTQRKLNLNFNLTQLDLSLNETYTSLRVSERRFIILCCSRDVTIRLL